MTESAAREQAREVYGDADKTIQQYVDILSSRGIEWGLLGPREGDRLWERHILNSVALQGLLPRDAHLVDVGSGAGLPGIPLAIARPDLMMTLLEPLERRSHFLELAVEELGLGDRVRVVRQRAEDHREAYDVVTCRAVANLTKLLGWTGHLFALDGSRAATGDGPALPQLVALKGASAQEEVDAAATELRRRRLVATVHEVRAHPDADPTYATVLQHRR